ncbi:MAG: glycine zipper 2TM domain-containing protein [Burkholderiaceae bacterium]
MTPSRLVTLFLLATFGAAGPALADDDRGKRREYKEEFWDGGCKIEREWKKNGDFKEERKCDGGNDRYPEGKSEFWDGPCKVEREWKKNGGFKEEVKCDGRGHRRGASVAPPPQGAFPPWVVVESGEPVYHPGHEPAPPHGPIAQCNSEVVGRVIGGIAGAVIGNQVGNGTGRAVATAGGVIAGVLIGGEVGRRIDANNQACIAQALEFAPAGQRVQWPAAGTQYAVVPGQVVTRNGAHCRPYEAEVLTSAGWQKIRGSACRRSDGAWVAAGS